MPSLRLHRCFAFIAAATLTAAAACGDDDATASSSATTTATSAGGSGGAPTTSTTTAVGTGGAPACTTDADCTNPTAAKCDTSAGTCVPCDASPQCQGLTGTEVCATTGDDAGTCIQCNAQEGCADTQTCNLLDNTCADVAPQALGTCDACTNDVQCPNNHRCVPMEYPVGTAHWYYCLQVEDAGNCTEPYTSLLNNRTTVNDQSGSRFCGIDEDTATCDAVRALLDNWRCTGTDGMCSPDGLVPEAPVSAALCRPVGGTANRCTYACAGASECKPSGAGSSCGGGTGGGPNWCGG